MTSAFMGIMLALVLTAPAAAFDLQAHRGGRGLAPENTLAAFRNAVSIGVTTLETDLALTRDGVLVLSHDPRLNAAVTRAADGQWITAPGPAIASLSLAQVRSYDVGRLDPASRYGAQWPDQRAQDGESIPTLAELFALVSVPGRAERLNLETKLTPDSDAGVPEPARFAWLVVDAVRSAGLSTRVTIQSFDWRTLVEVKRIAPEIETACLTIESPGMDTVRPGPVGASPWHAGLRVADHGSLPGAVRAAGCNIWSMFWRNLTPELARQARDAGLRLVPWTVNDPAVMGKLIELGVDGIITDYPDRLRAVMTARGMRTP